MKWKIPAAGLSIVGMLLATSTMLPTAQAASRNTEHSISAPSPAVSGFASTISSPATHGCVDVPGGVADINVYIYNSKCRAGLEEQFNFVPVPAVNGAYAIVNRASGMCMTQYRKQPRQTQGICTPVPSSIVSNALWYLVPLNAATHTYELQPVYRNHLACLAAASINSTFPDGERIPNLGETACDTSDTTQAFVINGAN